MEDLMRTYNLGAYLNITSDEHLNEYLGECDKRVELLTGFTGSNGLAVTCNRNALFTDSRYYVQAEKESTNYKLQKMGVDNLEGYISRHINTKRVGLNPRHYSHTYLKKFAEGLSKYNIDLIFVEEDFVDVLYTSKPQRKFNAVYSLEKYRILDFYKKNLELFGLADQIQDFMIYKNLNMDALVCGKTYSDKLIEVRKIIKDDEELIITELDTICCLFNLRGSDIEYNSVFYAYASICKTECKLFCNAKINLKGVDIYEYNTFEKYLLSTTKKTIVSNSCNGYLESISKNCQFTEKIRVLQSQKTQEEIEGFNLAYLLDGVALVKLFAWIDLNCKYGILEVDIENKLEEIKSQFVGYKYPSFKSIIGSASNSAIIHYNSNHCQLKNENVCLLDVGSNYIFGTTDTSRTLFLGSSTDKVRYSYTKVLKGQLLAMRQIYPKNISGNIIDSLTRLELWNNLENYGHAAGHGVGHFLCVHESPPSLSTNHNSTILLNQVFSIEPGIYYENEFGIRLENLVFTTEVDKNYMRLVNLTYVPYQLNLIDKQMLNSSEINFINKISKSIREKIMPFLKQQDEQEYLLQNTSVLY